MMSDSEGPPHRSAAPLRRAPNDGSTLILHSVNQVTLATLVAGPTACALLLADNYRRLGAPRAAMALLAAAVAVMSLHVLTVSVVMRHAGYFEDAILIVMWLVVAMIARLLMTKLQGDAINARLATGSRIGSGGVVFLVMVACILLGGYIRKYVVAPHEFSRWGGREAPGREIFSR